MASIPVDGASAALSADGTSDGYVTVTDNSPYWPGATAWLTSNTKPAQECLITNLAAGGKVGLRFKQQNKATGIYMTALYTRSDCSAYKVADGARLEQEPSVVPAVFESPAKKSSI